MEQFILDKPLVLPTKRLSWTQYSMWLTSKDRYKREYFYGAKKLDTKYFRFGKGIAKSIEDGTYKDKLPGLIVYELVEHKITTSVRGVPILSFIDSYDPVLNIFKEYKTGKNPWDQAMVQKHDQLTFYAVGLKWSTGEAPFFCDLDWIETTDKSDETEDFWKEVDTTIKTTGKIISFRRYFDDRELLRMENAILQVASEISTAYQEFISEL